MNKTPIEWVKNPDGTQGYTWNPITGCLNGCEYCYARKLANTRLKNVYTRRSGNLAPLTKDYIAYHEYPHTDPFYPRFWSDRHLDMLAETHKGKPRGIFVCDMSDLFGIGIPEKWTEIVLGAIIARPQHRFYLLTKQPQNLIKFSPFPDNCWVGVTATDRRMFIEALRGLKDVRAMVRYISIEPCLERVMSDDGWIHNNKNLDDSFMLTLTGIQWVILGAQTKPYKPPKIEWVEEIVQACDKAGIPVFLKNNLWSLLDGSKYAVPLWAFDKDSKLRQEFPIER